MSVTSIDVARIANVSQATVSRVINRSPNVSEAKRRAVMRAMEAVGYQPNALAQGLRIGRTSTVGVVVAGITNPFYPEMLQAVGRCLAAQGQRMVLWDSDAAGDEAVLDSIRQGLVDGVIFTSIARTSMILDEAVARVPVVLLNRGNSDAGCDTVISDNYEGARQAARYLFYLGHRRIGLLGGPEEALTASERMRGFLDAMADHAAPVADELVRDARLTHEGGRIGVLDLLNLPDPPTAVFCVNDLSGFGAIDGARSVSLDVPRDLSVIGYDNVAMAAWHSYRLTSVSQPIEALAGRAVDLLVRRMAQREGPARHDRFLGELVVRDTVAPVRPPRFHPDGRP